MILADLDDIRFGDVLLDTAGGPLAVNEIIRRRRIPVAEFADHRVLPHVRGGSLEFETSELRRIIKNEHPQLRVARNIERFAPLPGHFTRVRSHNPVRRGMYVRNDGWLTQCSCGWPGQEPRVCGGKQSARREWLEHKASVITDAACEKHRGFAAVTAVEREHELPPIPWSFAHNGVAIARLDELGRGNATQVADAWADAFGVEIEHGRRDDVVTFHVAVSSPISGHRLVVIDGFFDHPDGA